MNELQHSLAYSSSLIHGSSLGWDYHNYLGVLNPDKMSLMQAMDANIGIEPYSSFSSPPSHHQESDSSTGYLEDALIEFGHLSKRRRLLLPYADDFDEQSKIISPINDLEKSLWNLNPIWHQPVENFSCMNQIERFCGFSDEHVSTFRSRINEESNIHLVADQTESTPEETISASESPNSSSISSYKQPLSSEATYPTLAPAGGSSEDDEMMMRKKKKKKEEEERRRKVVYPFAVVKPGGIREGEVTLNDINERILMAPSRPVRHPVGDFACRPCVSPDGPGLSGKAVVALTRIHTLGGRGTITIIRTKG